MANMKRKEGGKVFAILFIFSISLFIILLDQLTKYLVTKHIELSQSIAIINDVFYLTYVKNTGAGFGILEGWNTPLIFISLIVFGIILFYIDKLVKEKSMHIPIALILGGVIGNLLNRIFLGYIVDFIDFMIWPAFNVADSCITIGILWLCILLVR